MQKLSRLEFLKHYNEYLEGNQQEKRLLVKMLQWKLYRTNQFFSVPEKL
jgi:hypothetical protein